MMAPAETTVVSSASGRSVHAARGDRKPCAQPGCGGMLQYGRRGENLPNLQPRAAAATPVDSTKGWICDATPAHFLAQ